jgi:hypothetical protein
VRGGGNQRREPGNVFGRASEVPGKCYKTSLNDEGGGEGAPVGHGVYGGIEGGGHPRQRSFPPALGGRVRLDEELECRRICADFVSFDAVALRAELDHVENLA